MVGESTRRFSRRDHPQQRRPELPAGTPDEEIDEVGVARSAGAVRAKEVVEPDGKFADAGACLECTQQAE
jgi:hypothetical protein